MSDSNRMSSILTAVKVVFTVVTVLLVWFLSYYINMEIVIVAGCAVYAILFRPVINFFKRKLSK